MLDREAIDADLRRRQQGYGRSPRQQIEHDEVEVLAGLRHGRTLGTPLALVVRNRDHKNWTWGMSPWPPEGEPSGKGTKPVTLPRPGHADLAGVLKYGLDDMRDALERASARHTAVIVAAGAVAKALLAEIAIEVAGAVHDEADLQRRVDEARAERDTVGGVVEVRARGVPPGLGSYATKDERLDARLAAALMGIQAVKGVEIGDGFALARSSAAPQAHDEILRDARAVRETNRAGGIEGRRLERRGDRRARGDEAAADADEAACARSTCRPASPARRSSSAATSPRSRRSPSSPRRASRSSSRARRARSSAATRSATSSRRTRAYLERIHVAPTHALDRHLVLVGFMGAGKTTIGEEVAGAQRPPVRRRRSGDRKSPRSDSRALRARASRSSGASRSEVAAEALSASGTGRDRPRRRRRRDVRAHTRAAR